MRKTKDARLEIRLPENELEQIKKNAKACNKTVSAYIREVGLNMAIIQIDNTCITDHTHEITAYKNAIHSLIFTIRKTGNYTPVDLEYIFEKTNELLKTEKEFLQTYLSNIQSIHKQVGRTVRGIVNNKSKKP